MGCKANLSDSQALESRLRSIGGEPSSQDAADVFVLNTCTVTDQADKEARTLVRKSKAKLTVAAGCMAEVSPDAFSGLNDSLLVARNSAKKDIAAAIEDWLAGTLAEQKTALQGDRVAWHDQVDLVEGAAAQSSKTRAFLKVQDGCNAFCSYCIIPRARGRSRSLTPQEVLNEVNSFATSGFQEVVLTAIHAADYESEGLDFTGLVELVLKKSSIPRVRLTSLDPAEIPDRLIELMRKEPRLCSHIHVSLQSANTEVLQAMKRGYNADLAAERLQTIAQKLPHAFVGMDIIAGFPGETEVQFEDSFQRLKDLPWTRLHVFPFSLRQGTAAAKLVESGLAVPAAIIKERARRLRELSEEKMQQALLRRVGFVAEVLVEEKNTEIQGRLCSQGHTRSYFKVVIPGKHAANQLLRVRLIGVANSESLKGELV